MNQAEMREARRIGVDEDVCDLPIGDGEENGRHGTTILERDDGGLAVQLALSPFESCGGIPPPEGRKRYFRAAAPSVSRIAAKSELIHSLGSCRSILRRTFCPAASTG